MKNLLFMSSRAAYNHIDTPRNQGDGDSSRVAHGQMSASPAQAEVTSLKDDLAQQTRWENWNAEVLFNDDAHGTIKQLADTLHTQDDFYTKEEYESIVRNSFKEHVAGEGIADEAKISTLWKHLKLNGCDQLRVEGGRLAAYRDGQKLTISELLKPEPILLETEAHKLYKEKRAQTVDAFTTARMAFLDSCKNLPPLYIS